MSMNVDQWVQYANIAEQQLEKDIHAFFTDGDYAYSEFSVQAKKSIDQMHRAQRELGEMLSYQCGLDNVVDNAVQICYKIDQFANTMHLALFQEDETLYGHPYERAWGLVSQKTIAEADNEISYAIQFITESDVHQFFLQLNALLDIDPYSLIMCIWRYALADDYSADAFSRALSVYQSLFHESERDNPDIAAAYLYVRNRFAGEDKVFEDLRNLLNDSRWDATSLQILASALNWMQCYKAEKTVLVHKLDQNLNMLAVEKERLTTLSQQEEVGPKIRGTPDDNLALDSAAISWTDDDFTEFFSKLLHQGKALSYSLLIRDDSHEVRIPAGMKLPDTESLYEILKTNFWDEYDDEATIKNVLCTSMTDAGNETFRAYLASTTECNGLAVLTRLIKIGKNLTIKSYILYMPQNLSLEVECTQAISLKKRLSSQASGWESSMEATVLRSIQQVLNDGPVPGSKQDPSTDPGEIIF